MDFQTYLKDCNCKHGGTLIYNGKIHCRWCRTPYANGGHMMYEPEHFPQQLTSKEVEKDYEIIDVVDDVEFIHPYNEAICGGCKIHSVKYLPTGEVFTVGDKTNKGEIVSFQIIKDKMYANVTVAGLYGAIGGCFSLSELKKEERKALFTTNMDKVDIFDGDKFSSVTHDLKIRGAWVAHKGYFEEFEGANCFSSEQAAKDYVRENEKAYSIADIKKVVDACYIVSGNRLIEELLKL